MQPHLFPASSHPGILCTIDTMYMAAMQRPLEFEKVDETLWRHGLAAALWVIGSARMVCILNEQEKQICYCHKRTINGKKRG